jgi:hypothetical protein
MADLVDLLPEQISTWTRSEDPITYDRETIFDYINGAGEVYRSYAFSQVAVAAYASPDGPDITVELFDMGNAPDAYGVFSYAREQEEYGIGAGYEHKGRVLCFWQDRYYACLASEAVNADTGSVLMDVARTVSQQLPPPSAPPDLVRKLPEEGRVAYSDRFFHVQQSLNYHYYLARDNVLNLGPDTDVVLARYDPGTTYVLIARYGSERDAAGALASFRQGYLSDSGDTDIAVTENGRFVSSRQITRHVVVVLDAVAESSAATLLQKTADRLTESPS